VARGQTTDERARSARRRRRAAAFIRYCG